MIYVIREREETYRHVTKVKDTVFTNMDRIGCRAVGDYFGDRKGQWSVSHSV